MKLERSEVEIFNALDKIKATPYSTEGLVVSVSQVAEYYEVQPKTINTLIERNRSEFEDDGIVVLKGEELKKFKEQCNFYEVNKKTSNLTILSLLAFFRMAFYLHSSNNAELLKKEILKKDLSLYRYLSKSVKTQIVKKYEMEMGYLLKSILGKHHNIEEQVSCKNYKIDFVIDGFLAIEVDEYGHSYYNQGKEIARENLIKAVGYKLMRYDTRNNNMLEFIGDVINELN